LMLIRTGPSPAAAASAIRYAWEMGADAINLSWGASSHPYTVAQIQNASSLARSGKGAVVTIAMVDADQDICATDISGTAVATSVGGSDDFDVRGTRSGRGSCIDLLAPAWIANVAPQVSAADGTTTYDHVSGIVTADRTGNPGYNDALPEPVGCKLAEVTSTRDFTRCFSGTSAAAPMVAGVVGLMLTLRPCLTRAQVQEILYTTADKIDGVAAAYDAVTGHSTTHGYGRVNAAAAVAATAALESDCTSPPTTSAEPARFELGARLGATSVTNTTDHTIVSGPGAGPMGDPVFYADAFIGNTWMIELQVGWEKVFNTAPTPDETHFAVAIQPAVFIPPGSGLYFGPNLAVRHVSSVSPSTTTGLGLAVGWRYLLKPFLAVRIEGLYRHWTSQSLNEVGVAVGLGVVLP